MPRAPELHWMVVLEATAGANGFLIDRGTVGAVLRALGGDSTVALHRADRLAVQLSVAATDIGDAFSDALDQWNRGAQPLLPRGWTLVWAEILRAEQFERAWGVRK